MSALRDSLELLGCGLHGKRVFHIGTAKLGKLAIYTAFYCRTTDILHIRNIADTADGNLCDVTAAIGKTYLVLAERGDTVGKAVVGGRL